MTFNFSATQCANCGKHYATHQGSCTFCGQAPPLVELEAVIVKKSRKVKVEKAPKEPSPLERQFIEAWQETGLPMPMAEYRFHPVRKWRFDFCFVNVDRKLAIELDGKPYGGRHTRGGGFIADLEKLNAAIELGYFVLRYHQVNEEAIAQVKRVYESL